MKNLLNPKWLLIINILPVTLLFVVFFSNYNIIESLLTIETKILWSKFFWALAILTGFQLAYLIFSTVKKKTISVYYALIVLVLYSALIYCYTQYIGLLIPNNIPNWMISSDIIMYPGTFLMPTLAHALFILVVVFSKHATYADVWLNFLYGISTPLAAYIFAEIILPLWKKPEDNYGDHTLIIFFIAASIFFLFFICRGFYVLTTLQSKRLLKYNLYWKILIALLLPLLGLCIKNGVLSNSTGLGTSYFGNFTHPWFYIIAIINGLLICLPIFKRPDSRLLRFFGLMICFPYCIYFFLVFLPYLPLAIVAVVVIGIGFLMLSPLFLFILQTDELYKEYRYLSQSYSTVKITIGSLIALSIIPLTITVFNLRDKKILNEALSYVYSPDYSKNYTIDRISLFNTITAIKANKRPNLFTNENIPFITPYYNWLVLDNMILSDEKISVLEQVFFGEKKEDPAIEQDNSIGKVWPSKIKVKSKFNQKQQYWISTLDLELTNPDSTNLVSYGTEFTLPEGCWIRDYYLHIGNRREPGILAEKKSALWVFSQIRNENRDPGILYYLTGNKIAFKVFPFAAKEIRKTGIEFIHKSPVTLNFAGHVLSLGKNDPNVIAKIETVDHATYIPATEKAKLKLVRRKPIYHFIIDISKNKATSIRSYMTRIKNLTSSHNLKTEDIRLNLTNAFYKEIPMDSDWDKQLNRNSFEGGFFLDGAIKKILVNSYKNNKAEFPVMIVLTDSLSEAFIQNDFADLKMTYPESPNFYELDMNHKLWIHNLHTNPKLRLTLSSTLPNALPVFAWPNAVQPDAYLPNDGQPSIVLMPRRNNTGLSVEKKSWLSGLNLQGMWIRNTINDNLPENPHLQLVKKSMQSGILSPSTSFLVVENQAQKMALLKKQEQILSGNKNLDPDEETQSMTEPNLYILIVLLLVIFGYRFVKSRHIPLKC